MLRRAAALVVLMCSFACGGSAERTLASAPRAVDAATFTAAQDAIAERSRNGGPSAFHVLVEVNEARTQFTFSELEESGAVFTQGGACRECLATTTLDGLDALNVHPAVVRVRPLTAKDRGSQRLQGEVREWESRPGGRVAYRFSVHRDVVASELEALTRPPLEARFEELVERFESGTIVIDPDRLHILLAEEIVSFVEPISPPMSCHAVMRE